MANKYTAEQMVQRAVVFIMQSKKWVSYSGVAMVGETKVVDDMPTAATDGLNKYFGRAFIDGLDDKQVRGVVLHETLHVMYRHLVTWIALFKENAMLANVAADYIVNGTIMEAQDPNVELPKGAIYDPTITTDKYNVYDVFQMLKSGKLANPMSGGCSGNCKASTGQDGTPSGQCSCPVGFDEHDWQASESMSDEEQKQAREAIDSAIRQGAILAGKMAGDTPRDIGELMNVKIDWTQVLREWLTNRVRGGDESTWNRPSRRWIGQGVYMPSQYTTSLGKVLFMMDTSGSIGGDDLTYFSSHLVKLLKDVNPEQVDVIWVDTQVAGHEVYKQGEYDGVMSKLQAKGGGGTSFRCVSEWLKKQPTKYDCMVALTDAYVSDWPEDTGLSTIWCVYKNENASIPYGAVAHI